MRNDWANYQIQTVRGVLMSRYRRDIPDEEIVRALDGFASGDMLTTVQAAVLYGISQAAMHKRISTAGLTPCGRDRRDGRKALWRKSDIEALMSRPDGRTRIGRRAAALAAQGAPGEVAANG